ncbi:CiaD-like domain-containing protein [Helicobacter brantae]|uniref:Campylobacter invasion antigen D C-terminal domain-containing protein n=1 Tax=Helicobacter brantae TaxID=375927 RepID=A0A3D8J372_9HELI|nr:hypothetical protein [Helicobacter brantae]RDU71211.1 hypothetical protein CQA58_03605 [Helicobacter brantae]
MMKINELKDVIVETLSQIDGQGRKEDEQEREFQDREMLSASLIDEREFLSMQRDKMLVLFEGLLSPETKEIEQKLELVLRYLQYQLSEIDKRLKEI